MVLRLLTPVFELQDLENWIEPQINVYDIDAPTNNVRRDHHKIIKKIGEESITLLKNDGALPLKAKEIQSSESIRCLRDLEQQTAESLFSSFPR